MVEQRFQSYTERTSNLLGKHCGENCTASAHAFGCLENCSVCKYSNEERKSLRAWLKNKDAAVRKMHDKLRDQEQLRSEAKTLGEALTACTDWK